MPSVQVKTNIESQPSPVKRSKHDDRERNVPGVPDEEEDEREQNEKA